MFRLDTNKPNRNETIDFINLKDKQIKSDENLSVAKLGMSKSCIQIEISFIFSKVKTMYRMNDIMTEPFQRINRAIRKPNSHHFINPRNSQNENDIKIHTCMMSRQLDHDNLELTTAMADSTFLKTMEPVVLCFLSVA
jgi:hypothetical protein